MKQIRLGVLVVTLGLLMTGVAFAVDIPNISTWTQFMDGKPGRGDVLLASIYDVRQITDATNPTDAISTLPQNQFTLFCVKNTDRLYGTVLRMRFREWKRSRECLDIDIPLTTNDVWCGQVARKSGGGFNLTTTLGGGERWVNADRVSTAAGSTAPNGYFQAVQVNPLPPLPAGSPFPSSTFDIESEEPNKDARCELGYIEFIGEERVLAPVIPTSGDVWKFPRLAATDDPPRGRDVQDVLIGDVFIVRPDQGMSHQYAMNALSDFAVDPNGIWDLTNSGKPNLFASVQGGPGNVGTNPGIGGFDQLEAILSRRLVYLDYLTRGDLDPLDPTHTYTSTSLVITFPTKRYHYGLTGAHDAGAFPVGPGLPAEPVAPFTGQRETLNDHLFTDATHTAIAACLVGENVLFKIYDRNENTFSPNLPISPPPQIPPGKLPYELNVIGYYPSQSVNAPIFRNNVVTSTSDGASNTFFTGYSIVDLGDNNQGKDNITFTFFGDQSTPGRYFHSYNGLPAIGIVMTEFFNDATMQYFGNSIPWQYRVDWWDTATAPNNIDLRQSPGELSWM